MKTWDQNRVYLNKSNLIILHWVIFLLRDWIKTIKKRNFLKEELLSAFSAASKVSKAAKNESDYNYHLKYAFYKFYRDFKKFKRISLGSKYDEINDFYAILNTFINTHEATTT